MRFTILTNIGRVEGLTGWKWDANVVFQNLIHLNVKGNFQKMSAYLQPVQDMGWRNHISAAFLQLEASNRIPESVHKVLRFWRACAHESAFHNESKGIVICVNGKEIALGRDRKVNKSVQ